MYDLVKDFHGSFLRFQFIRLVFLTHFCPCFPQVGLTSLLLTSSLIAPPLLQ